MAARWSFCIASLLSALRAESLLAAAHPSPSFDAFVIEHGRKYGNTSSEFQMRRGLYEQRVADYELHNSNPSRLWSASVNLLTDWTDEELASLRGWSGNGASEGNIGLRGTRPVARHSLGLRQQSDWWGSSLFRSAEEKILKEATSITGRSQTVTWTNLKSTQIVKAQGGCGSCWAHATVLAMEANHEIKRGSYMTFSADQLVHCAPNLMHCGGPGGCGGSTAEIAMEYVMYHGLSDSDECPESAASLLQRKTIAPSIIEPGNHDVPEDSPARKIGLVAWERLPENKMEPLMQALMDVGPAAVSVSATHWAGYGGGVLDACPPSVVIDHAVVLLGFGLDSQLGANYWNIRNSWGAGWGENGGIRLLRTDTDDSYCGEDAKPERGTGCTGGPSRVEVCGMCGILYDTMVPHFSA